MSRLAEFRNIPKTVILLETFHDQPFYSIPQRRSVNKTLNDWSQDLSLGLSFIGTEKLLWRGVIFSCVRMSTHVHACWKERKLSRVLFRQEFYIAVQK